MNKKGFIRIVEASLAILIIASVLFIFFNRSGDVENVDYSEIGREILEEVSRNNSLRSEILANNKDNLDKFVKSKIKNSLLSFETKICEINSACGLSVFVEGNIFSSERVISSTLDNVESKKIRLFIWEQE